MEIIEVTEGAVPWYELYIGDIPFGIYRTRFLAEAALDEWQRLMLATARLAKIEGAAILSAPRPLPEEVREFEIHRLTEALHRCGHNHVQTAKLLGIKRTTLLEKLKKYDLCETNRREPETNCGGTSPSAGGVRPNAVPAWAGDAGSIGFDCYDSATSRSKDGSGSG